MSKLDVIINLYAMPTRTLRLLHVTDTHLLGNPQALLRGTPPYDTLRAVQAHAAQRFAHPDAILLTGDLVHDDADGYALIRQAFAHETAPVYCVSGNHDVPSAMRKILGQPPFVLDDHVVMGNWLIILLNTWQAGRASGLLGAVQIERIRALLSTHQQRHTLICLHHHPIEMGSEWLDQVGLVDATEFRNCIAPHPQVKGVLWGHVHQALDTAIDGVRYMATPATCTQFLPGSDGFALDTRPPGYRTLELKPDGTLQSEVVWL
jgi:3',5'-cyclic-AMP phosphodiesterase